MKLNILKMKIDLLYPSAEVGTVKKTAQRGNLLERETSFRRVLDLVVIREGATL